MRDKYDFWIMQIIWSIMVCYMAYHFKDYFVLMFLLLNFVP